MVASHVDTVTIDVSHNEKTECSNV